MKTVLSRSSQFKLMFGGSQWENKLTCVFPFSLACRCAEKSSAKGYEYFGLQFYGECWSDPEAAVKFDHYGRSEDCMGIDYKQCDDEESSECVGGANKNYVYRVVEKGDHETYCYISDSSSRTRALSCSYIKYRQGGCQ